MTTTTTTAALLALTAALTLSVAAPAVAHCGVAHDGSEHHATTVAAKPAFPHPTGSDEVVITIEHSPNGWGGEYPEGSGVTVYGDGRVVIVPPSGAGPGSSPRPEATVLHVTEAGIQKVLRAATRAGLLRDADYGNAHVTDQGTSEFEIATREAHTASVYALLLEEGDRGLTRKQRANREALRDFARDAADPDFYDGTLDTR